MYRFFSRLAGGGVKASTASALVFSGATLGVAFAEPLEGEAKFQREEFLEDAAKAIIKQEPDAEFSQQVREWLSERERIRRSTPPLPPRSEWKDVSDSEMTSAINRHEERGVSHEVLLAKARDVLVNERIKLAELETPGGITAEDRELIISSVVDERVAEDLLSPITASKYSWHPCWQHAWSDMKAFQGLALAYSGTQSQLNEMMTVSAGDLREGEAWTECMRRSDMAENDEFHDQRFRRQRLLEHIFSTYSEDELKG